MGSSDPFTWEALSEPQGVSEDLALLLAWPCIGYGGEWYLSCSCPSRTMLGCPFLMEAFSEFPTPLLLKS